MDPKQMKLFGIICLVICAICLFVAVERYNANAGNVRAMNAFTESTPLGGMVGELKPATPAATKYSLLFAAISGVAGGVMLAKSGKPK